MTSTDTPDEARAILAAIAAAPLSSRDHAAAALGISRRALYRRIAKLGIAKDIAAADGEAKRARKQLAGSRPRPGRWPGLTDRGRDVARRVIAVLDGRESITPDALKRAVKVRSAEDTIALAMALTKLGWVAREDAGETVYAKGEAS